MIVTFFILAVAAALVLVGCRETRAGCESASYQVVHSSGRFAVRDCPALMVVEIPMTPTGKGADGSFNCLFRFITGGNEARQKIAMMTSSSIRVNARCRF